MLNQTWTLGSEVFQLSPFLGTSPPPTALRIRGKKLEARIKNGEISYKSGGRWGCTVLLAERLIFCRGSTLAQGWVSICYSKASPLPTRKLHAAIFARAESVPILRARYRLFSSSWQAPARIIHSHTAQMTLALKASDDGSAWKRVSTAPSSSHRRCLPWLFLWQVLPYKVSGTDAFTALRDLPLCVSPCPPSHGNTPIITCP